MSDENEKIFKEAFDHTFKITEDTSIEKISDKIIELIEEPEDQLDLAVKAVDNPVDEWDKVSEAMTGRLAKKFLETIDTLGDREFIRVYLKAIEYFKPKVTRTEPTITKTEDPTVQVNLMIRNEQTGAIEEIIINEKNT